MQPHNGARRLEDSWTLTAGGEVITRVAWSPQGDLLAMPTQSGAVHLSTLEGVVRASHTVSHKALWTAAWHGDGRQLALAGRDNTVHVIDPVTGVEELTLAGHIDDVHSVGWAAEHTLIYSVSYDGTLRVWSAEDGSEIRTIPAHRGRIEDALWNRDDRLAYTAGRDGLLRAWDLETGDMAREVTAHQGFVLRVIDNPTTAVLLTASSDGTVRVWDRRELRLLHTVQGITGTPHDLSLSPDGRLLAVQDDRTHLWIYRADSMELLDVVEDVADHHHWYGSARFHPTLPHLASTGGEDRVLTLRTYDTTLVDRLAAESGAARYANCRVALLGNTGVGKTALSRALCGKDFRATESTHGTRISLMDRSVVDDHLGSVVREVFLWDFAGQSVYRLVQPVEAVGIEVALLVLDNRNVSDPLGEIREWETLLRLGSPSGGGPKRIVVIARADRGGLSLDLLSDEGEEEILRYLSTVQTSARDGTNIPALRDLILGAIDWDTVPTLTSNTRFQQLRSYVLQQATAGRVMGQTRALYREFCQSCARSDLPEPTLDEFRTLLAGLDTEGLLRRLRFGDLVLLQPTIVGAYASMLVIAAQQVADGSGTLTEDDVLALRIPLLEHDRVADREHEEDIMHAAIEELLSSGALLRDETRGLLRFPSAVRRRAEDSVWRGLKGRTVLRTRALTDHAYASVVGALLFSGLFTDCELWASRARFARPLGGSSWISVHPDSRARIRFELRHDTGVSDAECALFEELCRSQAGRHAVGEAVDVVEQPICDECGTAVSAQQRQRRTERGFDWITCGVCDRRVELGGTGKPLNRPAEVRAIESAASHTRTAALHSAEFTLKEKRQLYDVFISYSREDEGVAVLLAQRLREEGIRPWIDLWETSPGTPWVAAIQEQLETMPCAAVLVGPSGVGPWQKDEVWFVLQEFLGRRCPIIPVLLQGAKLPVMPPLLRNLQAVDFNRELPDPMHLLLWGITGIRPEERTA
ncbi:WD40 repeat protein [Streptomyces sp. Ag109_O5-1]|uniref:TIR domain-containing protein n=1 Tax=Streptomyces sp. Ag109_O5-1 TaxID=1938851 RepID=UPI000F4EE0B2|nr:TIR domain-containing protein [Streptomyces sp. Ag109_O5-1]RPE38592.1 WD40 repeat protein [Streptomyces sp. Ag109_O5-1]